MSKRPERHDRTPGHDAGPLEAALTADRGLGRRDFLRVSATMAAGAALAGSGCQPAVENVIPYHERPESQRQVGKPLTYATVLDGVPVLVRTREGRPILVTAPADHPAPAGLTVRSQAALLDLYDADRAQGPLSVRRGKGTPAKLGWPEAGAEAVRALKAGRDRVALLVRPATGVATRALYDGLARDLGVRVVEYEPIQPDAAVQAWKACFGDESPAVPRVDRAKLVVGLGPEFLDCPGDGLEAAFAARRSPDAPDGMTRLVVFEGRLSLTGANADRRIRVRDSDLPVVALALAREVIAGGAGPLAGDAALAQALAPFTPEFAAQATGVPVDVLKGVAKDLIAAGPGALVLAGDGAGASTGGVALHIAANLLNASLGALGTTLDPSVRRAPARGGVAALARLADDLRAGKVTAVIVAGPNPVYDAPAPVKFAEALASAAQVVSLNDRLDETSRLADVLAPASHPFEAWGDAALPGGIHVVQQPAIRPLYATFGLADLLLSWGVEAGLGGEARAAVAAAQPPRDPAAPLPNPSPAWHFVRAVWGRQILKAAPGTPAFDDAWEAALRDGFARVPAVPGPAPRLAMDPAALSALAAVKPAAGDRLELHLHPSFTMYDGRAGNNGWLHELPDPLTRATWGNWVAVAPKRFDALGLKNGALVEVAVGDAAVTLPAYRHAGLHADVIAIPLGLGRTAAGKVGDGVGRNAFPLATLSNGTLLRAGLPARLTVKAGGEDLAITQGAEVLDRNARPLLPVATLSKVKADPRAGTEQRAGGPSIWPAHDYKKQRWVMAIDLTKCNGCGKCAVGCQAENNIPVVGRESVIQGREMSWIRVDRYWDAGRDKDWDDTVWDGPQAVVEEPRTLFQPMLCQHCENAPCETVCPFVATMHSEDGLNQQVYNRCVGTRYCANNCPFKVRRFNWFEYSKEQTNALFRFLVPQIERHAQLNARGRLPMKNNPEVTVRSRGVMEKCSFCVQRIREARAEATRQGRPGKIPDGAVVPACMEACPTGAIVFGDANDPNSRVAGLAANPRAMRLLEETGVKPSVAYLTKVIHDDGNV